MQDLSRQVTLFCPTCGNDQFSYEETSDGLYADDHVFACANCGRRFTKRELVERNSDVISANVDEITEEAAAELQKELSKILKKTFK